MSNNAFLDATRSYEDWLGGIIELNAEELQKKHKKMAKKPFDFLRASFYRWATLWNTYSQEKKLVDAPEVLGVGDLHVENFGTWRDVDGRLAWGINDFDEACCLPYLNDLVRLAVSADMALDAIDQPAVNAERACELILQGYTLGREAGQQTPDDRRPYVLAQENDWLRTIAFQNMENQAAFDKIVNELKDGALPSVDFAVPPEAREALAATFPPNVPGYPKYRIGQREAGLGSIGRQRFSAVIDDWNGGLIAREAKALAPSAWMWASGRLRSRDIWYATVLQNAVRSRDPWVLVYRGWIVRRLAADAGKIKLEDIPLTVDTNDPDSVQSKTARTENLLEAMGRETANIHSWSKQPLTEVSEDLRRRAKQPGWFRAMVVDMKQAVVADFALCQSVTDQEWEQYHQAQKAAWTNVL